MNLFAANILGSDWLARPCLGVGPDLIGCYLVGAKLGERTNDSRHDLGRIVETEAYTGEDPAYPTAFKV